MKRLLTSVGVAVIAVAAALTNNAAVFADSPGQLSNGESNYEVRNVTTNGSYAQSATVTCDQTIKYSIFLANSDFGELKNLTVKADIASGAISASATNEVDATTSVSGKVAVTVEKGTLAYVAGSTVRLSADGKTSTPVADGITAGGVNVGDLTGSTQTFVQFQAKVTCATPPTDNCPIPGKENLPKDSSECKETPVTPVTPTTPSELPQTGAGSILAFIGLGALVASIAYYITSRRSVRS